MKYILNDKSKNINANLSHETFKLKYIDKKRNRSKINNKSVLSEEQWTKWELWVTFFPLIYVSVNVQTKAICIKAKDSYKQG